MRTINELNLSSVPSLDGRSGTSYGNISKPSSETNRSGDRFPYTLPPEDFEAIDDMFNDPIDIDAFITKTSLHHTVVDPYRQNVKDRSALAKGDLKMYETQATKQSTIRGSTGAARPSGWVDVTGRGRMFTNSPGRWSGSKRGWAAAPDPNVPSKSSLMHVMNFYDIPTDDERAMINAADPQVDDEETSTTEFVGNDFSLE